jgi:hypothetical protein
MARLNYSTKRTQIAPLNFYFYRLSKKLINSADGKTPYINLRIPGKIFWERKGVVKDFPGKI